MKCVRLFFPIAVAAVSLAQTPPQYLDFGIGVASAAVTDKAGNLYVAGYYESPADAANRLHSAAGPTQMRAYKVTPSGVVAYSYNFRGWGVPLGVAVDNSGGLFMVGYAYCDDRSAQPPVHPLTSSTTGSSCGFIAKLDPSGSDLLFYTTLGGLASKERYGVGIAGSSAVLAVAVDSAGAVYVGGETTSHSFPTTPNAFQPSPPVFFNDPGVPAQASCGFVTKIHQTLDSLDYSTFLCGVHRPVGAKGFGASVTGIAVGADGVATVAGWPDQTDFPLTPGAVSRGGEFVARLTADGNALIWSAGVGLSDPRGLALDSTGNVVLPGRTWDPGAWVVTPGGFLPLGIQIDRLSPWLLVTKLSSDGTTLLATTFLGGSLSEQVRDLNVDPQGNVWVLGTTQSSDFPTLPGSLSLGNTFVTEFRPGLNGILQTDRLPSLGLRDLFPLAGHGGALPLDPSGSPILVGDSGSILRLPERFETQPGILSVANSAATYVWPYIAPGSFLSLYGVALGPSPAVGAAYDRPGHLATNLGGVTVTFNGTPASLLYAGPSQVNVIVPFGISGQPTTTMRIQNAAGLSQAVVLPVVLAAPYIFNYLPAQPVPSFVAGESLGYAAAALNQDGTVNSASNPAHPGEILTIFANGAGLLQPTPADGTIIPRGSSFPLFPVQVCLSPASSHCVDPIYAGNAPQQVAGVLQVNFRLPPFAEVGLVQSVVLVVGDYLTEPVVIYEMQQ